MQGPKSALSVYPLLLTPSIINLSASRFAPKLDRMEPLFFGGPLQHNTGEIPFLLRHMTNMGEMVSSKEQEIG